SDALSFGDVFDLLSPLASAGAGSVVAHRSGNLYFACGVPQRTGAFVFVMNPTSLAMVASSETTLLLGGPQIISDSGWLICLGGVLSPECGTLFAVQTPDYIP